MVLGSARQLALLDMPSVEETHMIPCARATEAVTTACNQKLGNLLRPQICDAFHMCNARAGETEAGEATEGRKVHVVKATLRPVPRGLYAEA